MLRRPLLIAAAAVVCLLLPSAAAAAAPRVATAPVAGNPAERLVGLAIDPARYEPATRCLPRARRPGTERFAAWLKANAGGAFWGSYRCERWGRGSASLHSEKRAVDWHLDAGRRADRREAQRVIGLLTAPDSAGNAHALARRMGVQEIIWDCAYWGAGMTTFRPYSPCLRRGGRLSRRVNATVAHRDHIHFGLTRDGALGRTSFWTGATPAPAPGVAPDVAPAPGGGLQSPAGAS